LVRQYRGEKTQPNQRSTQQAKPGGSTNCAEKEEEKEEEKHSQCGGSIVSLREESVFLHLSPHSNGRDKRSASINRSIARLLFQRCVAHQGLRSLSSVPPT
jgi:hypothetical protein